jgi:hypothetical protein
MPAAADFLALCADVAQRYARVMPIDCLLFFSADTPPPYDAICRYAPCFRLLWFTGERDFRARLPLR